MEERKLSFFEKIKISIVKLEDYQKLAAEKVVKTISYLVKLMLIFATIVSIAVTFCFAKETINIVEKFDKEVSLLIYENGELSIKSSKEKEELITIETTERINAKIILDTNKLEQTQIDEYIKKIDGRQVGIILLKDRVIFKTDMMAMTTTSYFSNIADEYNINYLEKSDIINFISGDGLYTVIAICMIIMTLYLFIIYLSTVLLDAILYSILAYIEGILSRLRLRYSAVYNIAVHAMTLPIILNLIYIVVNTLTGFTIKYFQIMYTAITCIYIIAAILIIKSDVIKKQMELSKIIEEQEKIRMEMLRKEQEEKEEAERERIRKEDEKKRKEEKDKKKENKENPQPEANIKPSKL